MTGNSLADAFTRRSFLTGAVAVGAGGLVACGRKRASPYAGFLYVARGGQKSIAVIDLSSFRWAGKIDLPTSPVQLARAKDTLLALCPESSAVYPIDLREAKPFAPIRFPSRPAQLLICADGETGVVFSPETSRLYSFHTQTGKPEAHVQLGGNAAAFHDSGPLLAVSIPSQGTVAFYQATSLKPLFTTRVSAQVKTLRFRGDGRTLLAGAWDEKQIVTLDTRSGALLARLPVSITPERFCFNSNGGQMFVSGEGADAITIVNPYQNEVDQTILAGRTPGFMTTTTTGPGTPELLLVANRQAGDLTVIDIDTRHVSASVHVGEQPGAVLVTPNNEFALILNRGSGDVAVVRLKTVLDHKNRTKSLFTIVPVGAEPVSAVIMPASV